MARKRPPDGAAGACDPAGPLTPAPFWTSRAVAIAGCAVIFFAVLLSYAGEDWLAVLSVLCTDGLLALLWVMAAAMLGWVILEPILGPRRNEISDGLLRLVTAAALGLGLFSLLGLGLGLAGLLNRATALALPAGAVLTWTAAIILRRGNVRLQPYTQAAEQWLHEPACWHWLWTVAMPILAIAAVAATLPPGLLWPHDPHPYDVLEYHLQIPREWYDAQRIIPLRHNVFSFFPFNVEMQYLLAMHVRGGPWAAIYLAHFLTLAHMVVAIAGIAAAVLALSQRADRPFAGAAPLAGVAATGVPWATMLGSIAYNEAGLLLFATLAIGWALLAGNSAQNGRLWAMAGFMAGLACGAKYTAVPIVMIALPLALLAAELPRIIHARREPQSLPHPLRSVIRGLTVYLAAGLLLFSPWFVRNVVWTGNPVFPEAMSLLGQAHFSPDQVDRWHRAHSPRDDQRPMLRRLKAAQDQILLDWRYGFLLIPLSLIAGARAWRNRVIHPLAILFLLLAIFWLGFTHLQSRFFVLAVPPAAIMLALSLTFWPGVATAALIAVAAISGWVHLHLVIAPVLLQFRSAGVIGLQDLTNFLPEGSQNLVIDGRAIALIGDAQAFVYVMPTSGLRYRTVFDVKDEPTQSTLDDWIGPDAEAVKATHYLILDYPELRRFRDTYSGLNLSDEEIAWFLEQYPTSHRFSDGGGRIILKLLPAP